MRERACACLCMRGLIPYGGSVTLCKYKLYKVETERKDTIWPKAHFMQPQGQGPAQEREDIKPQGFIQNQNASADKRCTGHNDSRFFGIITHCLW